MHQYTVNHYTTDGAFVVRGFVREATVSDVKEARKHCADMIREARAMGLRVLAGCCKRAPGRRMYYVGARGFINMFGHES